MFTKDDLGVLLAGDQQPCVSLFMATHPADPQQDGIRLKNLIQEADAKLEELGLRRPDRDALLEPASDLLAAEASERHADLGLAIFLAPNRSHVFHLPIEFEERCLVGRRMHIKPLLPLLVESRWFYLLTVQLEQVRLFEASRFELRELSSDDLPRGLVEILERTDFDPQTGLHAAGPRPSRGDRAEAKFHSIGSSPKDYLQTEIDHFVRDLANAVDGFMSGRSAPLVLCAEAQLQGAYRQHAKTQHLVDRGIDQNPASLSDEQLRERAYEVVGSWFEGDRHEAIEQFEALVGRRDRRAIDQLGAIVGSAASGRVDTLFVALDAHEWGSFDQAGSLSRHDAWREDSLDLLDLAAASAIEHGGTVYALPRNELPGARTAAAILRY